MNSRRRLLDRFRDLLGSILRSSHALRRSAQLWSTPCGRTTMRPPDPKLPKSLEALKDLF